MNSETIALLKECSSGSKMGIHSLEQVAEYVNDMKLLKVLNKYKDKHEMIWKESADTLRSAGEEVENPGVMASMMSWISTEMKLMIENDNTQVAKVLLDGCNMGIQTITEMQHKYANAETEATQMAKELIEMEEDFRKELKKYL